MKYLFLMMFLFTGTLVCSAQFSEMRGVFHQPQLQYVPYEVDLIEGIFIVNDSTDIGRINRRIDSLARLHTRFEDRISPNSKGHWLHRYSPKYYCELRFVQVNEDRIDSLIGCLTNRCSIIKVEFHECPIRKIPLTLNILSNLCELCFFGCDSLVSVGRFDIIKNTFGFSFKQCRIRKLPEGIENYPQLLNLEIDMPLDFKGMDLNSELSRFKRRNNLFNLFINYFQYDEFPYEVTKLTALRKLILFTKYNGNYPEQMKDLINLRRLFCIQNESTIKLREYFDSCNKQFTCLPFLLSNDDPDFLYEQYISAIVYQAKGDQRDFNERFIIDYTTLSWSNLELTNNGFSTANSIDFNDSSGTIRINAIPNTFELEIIVNSTDNTAHRRYAETKDIDWKTLNKFELLNTTTKIDFKTLFEKNLDKEGIFLAITIDDKIYSVWIRLEK